MESMVEPKPGEIYQHFKSPDKKYRIICVAIDCEDPSRRTVRYAQLYANEFPIGKEHSRSIDEFMGDKVFEEDTSIGSKLFKKGDRVKRFMLVG